MTISLAPHIANHNWFTICRWVEVHNLSLCVLMKCLPCMLWCTSTLTPTCQTNGAFICPDCTMVSLGTWHCKIMVRVMAAWKQQGLQTGALAAQHLQHYGPPFWPLLAAWESVQSSDDCWLMKWTPKIPKILPGNAMMVPFSSNCNFISCSIILTSVCDAERLPGSTSEATCSWAGLNPRAIQTQTQT